MNNTLPQSGVFPALWTPTDAGGRLLEAGVREQIAHLRAAGVHGLMILGSTGEFPLFGASEREDLLRRLVALAAPLPVIANISDIRPAVVARLARAARESGCAAVAVLPPWYFAISQADLLEFFLRAAEAAAPVPVWLYNFPERVGTGIATETLASFADRMPLGGVKLSGGAWALHAEVVALGRQRGFPVWTGWDTRLADAMALGCSGCISGLANFAAEAVLAVFRAMHSGDPAAAAPATRQLQEMAAAFEGLNFPHDIAAGMAARGRVTGEPKQVMSERSRLAVEHARTRLEALFRSWGWT
ncbi:MAG: dihydrodipicolinate synthase family protein [Verrucomicrobiae bacterium]|nr:dihydrodipicolinate synthase family protein [Verrucomicrobiae bacterium]